MGLGEAIQSCMALKRRLALAAAIGIDLLIKAAGDRAVRAKRCRDWEPGCGGLGWARAGCQGNRESHRENSGVGMCFHVGQSKEFQKNH